MTSFNSLRNLCSACCRGLFAVVAIVGTGHVVSAQPAQQQPAQDPAQQAAYQTLPILEQFRMPPVDNSSVANRRQSMADRKTARDNQKARQNQVESALRGGLGVSDAAAFEQWFNGYVFPAMTQTDDETLGGLGEMRRDFFANYLQKTSPGQARTKLIDELTIPTMQQIVAGNFHPAARVNATLLLGRLVTAEGRSPDTLPVPHAGVFEMLLGYLDDANLPLEVKIAAMSGLDEHARYRVAGSGNEFSNADRRRIGDKMLEVLSLQADANTPQVWVDWMQRRAVRILGLNGIPGANGSYAKALRDVIADKDQYLMSRVDAVEAYAMIEFSDPSQAAGKETARAIGELVIWALKNDAKYIENVVNEMRTTAMFLDDTDITDPTKKAQAAGGGGIGGGLGRGGQADGPANDPGTGTGPDAEEVKVHEVLPEYRRVQVRRRVNTVAHAGQVALVGEDAKNPSGGLYALLAVDANGQPLAAGERLNADATMIRDLGLKMEALIASTDVSAPDKSRNDRRNQKKTDNEKPDKTTLAEKLVKALNSGADSLQQVLNRSATADPPPAGNTGQAGSSGQ